MPPVGTVHILMAVYNGDPYLPDQLESFATQTRGDWVLHASDDGSDDDSVAHLQRFAARYPSTQVLEGPRAGGAANFLSLIHHLARTKPEADALAFADQDDKWMPHKLERACAWLEEADPDRPALYCSRSLIAGGDLSQSRLSPARPKPTGFRNALVQNIAAGNTILLNRAATRLVLEAAVHVDEVVVHDWWVYQLVTGAGGVVLHDDKPGLIYRQHTENQIGANDGWAARMRRIGMLLRGDFRDWNDVNIAALSACSEVLTPEARSLLHAFEQMRGRSLVPRLIALQRLGLYRQSRASTLALWVAAVLRRI